MVAEVRLYLVILTYGIAYPWRPKTQEGPMLALDYGTSGRLVACKKSDIRVQKAMEFYRVVCKYR